MISARLVASTKGVDGEDAGELLARAFSQCYQREASIGMVMRNLRHQSVLEHVSFTFDIIVSRVCWEQLVRHRIASYTAQSHRYTDIEIEDCTIYIPTEIKELGEDAVEQWVHDAQYSWAVYRRWRDRGVTKQTARYLAPKGVAIRGTVTFNLRSLINMLTLRTGRGAQEEIKSLAELMWSEIEGLLPPELYGKIEEVFLNGHSGDV